MGGVGGPIAVLWAGIRCPVGTRGVGEWGDEKAIGGGSPGLWQGRDGVVSGVTECVKGKETGLFEASQGAMRQGSSRPQRAALGSFGDSGVEVTGGMRVAVSARTWIRRFWR
jgi:hypothetical protein